MLFYFWLSYISTKFFQYLKLYILKTLLILSKSQTYYVNIWFKSYNIFKSYFFIGASGVQDLLAIGLVNFIVFYYLGLTPVFAGIFRLAGSTRLYTTLYHILALNLSLSFPETAERFLYTGYAK